MLLVRAEARPSKIHGIGCFALEDIPKGAHVWVLDSNFDLTWHPTLFKLKTIDVVRDNISHHVYQCKFTNRFILCADAARFINHSYQPNVKDIDHGLLDAAVRNIQAGEELTVDYTTFTYDRLEWGK